jgi:3-oxoacyl-[acyl-carrier-protein] synthase II
LREVFGRYIDEVPISSTKGSTGHLCGAAGSIEAAFCLFAMRDSILPATINYSTRDPECDIDCIPNVARTKTVEYALSNSFGFGGHNVSLLFKRADS